MARFLRIVPLLFLSCLTAYSQTGISVYDRLQEQREAFPLERVYVHTDAEDYLQGDRIWLKAYLMDEVDHTPVDSTLYVYAELFDKNGKMARQVSAYLVVLEGVTSEGRLVHEEIPFEVSQ